MSTLHGYSCKILITYFHVNEINTIFLTVVNAYGLLLSLTVEMILLIGNQRTRFFHLDYNNYVIKRAIN